MPVTPSKESTYGDVQESLLEELRGSLKAVRCERDTLLMEVMNRIIKYRKAVKRSLEMEYQKESWYKEYLDKMSSYHSTILSITNRIKSLRR